MNTTVRTRWIARSLLIAWAGFWLFFNVGSFFAELPSYGLGSAVNHLSVALIALALLAIAWRWELAGALLLLATAAFAVFVFRLYEPNRLFVLLGLPLPMVAASVLLIAIWLTSKRA